MVTTQQGPGQAPQAVDRLGDSDPDVRLRAALDLGEQRAAESAEALVARLGLEREFFIRETLTWSVLRIIDAATPYLREALVSPRWLARMQAAHVLSKLGRAEDAAGLVPLVAGTRSMRLQRGRRGRRARLTTRWWCRRWSPSWVVVTRSSATPSASRWPTRCGLGALARRSPALWRTAGGASPRRGHVEPAGFPGRGGGCARARRGAGRQRPGRAPRGAQCARTAEGP